MTTTYEKSHENTRSKLTVAVAAISAGLALAPGLAQSAVLEEVFVTAQKRVQSLQDVPVSVVAVSGETIEAMGIISLEAVSATIPTLHIGEAQIGEQLFIRGIGSGVNAGFEQSVGTYVDGIYLGRGRQSKIALFDVETIEVLKGPQGTLFGKNTIAGALNITSANPTEEFHGSITGLYEFEQEQTIFTGIVSGPLTDTLRGRLSAQWSQMDAGWIENDWRGGDDEPTSESTIVRLGLEWDATEDLSMTFKYTYNDFDQDGRNSELTDNNGKYPGAPFVGNMPELLAPYGEFGKQDEVRNVGGTRGSLFDRDHSDSDMNVAMLNVTYQLGDLELTSITGYTDYDLTDAQDNDVTPLDILAMQTEEDYKQYSQELRLTSPGGETIDYIVGAYYQYDELDTTQMINVDLLDISVHPQFGIVGPPIFSARYAHMYQETTSWAVFSQMTWNITDTFRTTLGLRYADDDKDVKQELRLTEFADRNVPLATLTPPASGVVPGFVQVGVWGANLGTFEHTIKDDQSKDNFTASLNAQWDMNDEIMLYASVSSGYKSGGFDAYFGNAQGEWTTSPDGFDFKQEEVTAFEIGAKMSLLDGAAELNMAAFYNKFDDVQVSTFDGGLSLRVGNAAETVVEGVEVEGRWALTDSLSISGAVAYLDAYYDDFDGAQCYFGQSPEQCTPDPVTGLPGQDLSDEDLQFAPEWAGHLSLEHFTVLGAFELRSRLDLSYSDDYWIDADLDPRSQQDSFTKVDLRVALSDSDDTWELAFIGRNLTDEDTSTWANDTALAAGGFYNHIDRLRSYALQAQYRF